MQLTARTREDVERERLAHYREERLRAMGTAWTREQASQRERVEAWLSKSSNVHLDRDAQLRAMALVGFGGIVMLLATALGIVAIAVVGLVVLLAGLGVAASPQP
jgi:hypothetical protein